MSLNAEQLERLETLLQGLEPEIKNLNPSSRTFVRDQLERFERWGSDIKLSPKQWAWLEDLYKKNVGELPGDDGPPDNGQDDDIHETNIDDEIPF